MLIREYNGESTKIGDIDDILEYTAVRLGTNKTHIYSAISSLLSKTFTHITEKQRKNLEKCHLKSQELSVNAFVQNVTQLLLDSPEKIGTMRVL